MSIEEVLSDLWTLGRADELGAVQVLAPELAPEDDAHFIPEPH